MLEKTRWGMLSLVLALLAQAAIAQAAIAQQDLLQDAEAQDRSAHGVRTQEQLGTDAIYMEETVITGNQELPKVLYILPWREMATEPLPERTLSFESQSLLVPIYPAEQKRQLEFKRALDNARAQQASQEAE